MMPRARLRQRDVTERVLLAALRQEARADAAEAVNVARAQRLAHTAHDLRTPLQAIGGYAELIELGLRGPVTDAQHVALGRIQDAARHILGITDALLDETREDLAPFGLPAELSVPAALDTAVALVAPQAAAGDIRVVLVPGDPRLTVRADPGKLRQVLVNLLANAVKFTPAGGTITVSGAAEGGRVAIRATDTGCGIAPDQLARIFEPYVQVGEPRTTRDAGDVGLGLGLAISRDLVRGMAGDLTVVSTPGVGSTFTVTLPPPTP